MPPVMVYLLPLDDNGSPNIHYIQLPPPSNPPYILRFEIEGTSSICRMGSLWHDFDGKQTEIKLEPDFAKTIHIDISIRKAGTFSFYTTYTPLPDLHSQKITSQTRTGINYVNVTPNLTLNGEPLPPNALSVFSIISKLVGPKDWDKHLQGITERGYNMVHFTPLVKRGSSNSPYSIFNQLEFDQTSFPGGESDVEALTKRMETKYNLLSLTDVVWNHTANNSEWLEKHPEAGYNITTAPWLESALDLDNALLEFGATLYGTTIAGPKELDELIEKAKSEIHKINLWEFYIVDIEAASKAAIEEWPLSKECPENVKDWTEGRRADFLSEHGLKSTQLGGRYSRKIEPALSASILTSLLGSYSTSKVEAAKKEMTSLLNIVNVSLYKEYDTDIAEAFSQLKNRLQYTRLDEHGPRLGHITKENPLIESYFTRLRSGHALVNNGWIWNADAMVDNAGPQSKAYTRREIIVWTDCVKLRYGSCKSDNPWLWEYMAEYTRLMAKHFAGFRIDNCHSTPLVVAEYLLVEARKVRPNLYVCAELFTGSEDTDYLFVKRLGLSSLIREAMQAWSTAEMSRLVHMHGGKPIGSFDQNIPVKIGTEKRNEKVMKTTPSLVHALLMDCTHDNEVPAQKRDARDTLPNAALVAMCACAVGSVMGYDEIYPKLIDLVHEKRFYDAEKTGISSVKTVLNSLHYQMGKEGYDEMHVHHDGEYITIHRVHPRTKRGYFLIAHTAYPGSSNSRPGTINLKETKTRHIGSWTLQVDSSDAAISEVEHDVKKLRGLPSKVKALTVDQTDGVTVPEDFPPGSISLFETWIPSVSAELENSITEGATLAFSTTTLEDLNFLLYRCDAEERDSSDGRDGVYAIPKHGPLVYAGFQGWWSILRDIVENNDLGHPLCQHLRDGHWPLDFVTNRLDRSFASVKEWLTQKFDAVRKLPDFLLPRYFALIIQTAYYASIDRGISLMSGHVKQGPVFLQDLALVSIQQTGRVKASLYPTKSTTSLAAGLPHFSTDWARCWGRDVFISLRGLFLVTGRYDEAKSHILAFASVLKHGMIPNLLSSGRLPRYNARDSVWFFLQSIQDYVDIVPGGHSLLLEKVQRRFLPYDDTCFEYNDPRAYSQQSTLVEIVQEILQRHATGLSFTEANAGPGLDMQMKPEGFVINVQVDWNTGLIHGGNQHNCGTWQDKMGESEKAGSKGVPGTPRDGAAVEITGLLYSSLLWLTSLYDQGKYPYDSVKTENGSITLKEWSRKIKGSFERCYYVPLEKDSHYDVNENVVNRRGIYKDLYRSGKEFEDYQLRANFPVAMCVAPGLFTPKLALQALAIADSVLHSKTGMATLDPSDLNYRPYYNNSEDSDDFATAKGRNYHQGPEWLWPAGYFLRALLKFDMATKSTKAGRVETFQQITKRLAGCKAAIKSSPWAGLTELTNKNGEFCSDSSPTQAWSAACLLDLFYDASQMSIES